MLLEIHFSDRITIDVNSKAVQEAISDLVHLDLIAEDVSSPTGYSILSRGQKLVQMLCETPLPEQKFVDPRQYVSTSNQHIRVL